MWYAVVTQKNHFLVLLAPSQDPHYPKVRRLFGILIAVIRTDTCRVSILCVIKVGHLGKRHD
jgi:hypothetical protein